MAPSFSSMFCGRALGHKLCLGLVFASVCRSLQSGADGQNRAPQPQRERYVDDAHSDLATGARGGSGQHCKKGAVRLADALIRHEGYAQEMW
eukprot:4222540-Amphidinium_carterae.1